MASQQPKKKHGLPLKFGQNNGVIGRDRIPYKPLQDINLFYGHGGPIFRFYRSIFMQNYMQHLKFIKNYNFLTEKPVQALRQLSHLPLGQSAPIISYKILLTLYNLTRISILNYFLSKCCQTNVKYRKLNISTAVKYTQLIDVKIE